MAEIQIQSFVGRGGGGEEEEEEEVLRRRSLFTRGGRRDQ
jgi:hypothetical protein